MTVHPHACGADVWLVSFAILQLRFTPTPVGQTPRQQSMHIYATVHPHACGADELQATDIIRRQSVHPHACGADDYNNGRVPVGGGSPPRLWGRLWDDYSTRFNSRFTPTPVGQTALTVICCSMKSVHPHACGADADVAGGKL